MKAYATMEVITTICTIPIRELINKLLFSSKSLLERRENAKDVIMRMSNFLYRNFRRK